MNPFANKQSMPGMEFFQTLLKGSGMPSSFASWMAPTMDADELERKITELKAVLQWLEANARLTQATIQGLEVQRMTLSALKTMNVDLGGLAERMSDAMQAGAQAMGAAARDGAGAQPAGGTGSAAAADAGRNAAAPEAEPEAKDAAASALPGVMDPMEWWSAVGQQFTQVAAQALRDSPWPIPAASSTSAEDAQAPEPGTRRGARAATKKTAAKTVSAAGSTGAPRRRSGRG